jgi:hypothetical protein
MKTSANAQHTSTVDTANINRLHLTAYAVGAMNLLLFEVQSRKLKTKQSNESAHAAGELPAGKWR